MEIEAIHVHYHRKWMSWPTKGTRQIKLTISQSSVLAISLCSWCMIEILTIVDRH